MKFHFIKLYLKYFSIHLKSCMQYKMSFFFTVIGQFLVSFNVFLGIYFMMNRFHSVAGFSYSEILLCFSIFLMEFALAETFARGFDSFSGIISNGEFDRIMVRPQNEMLQVLGSRIEFTRIVPFALIQYYPLLYLLDRKVSILAPIFPLIADIFVIPCYLFWKFGVAHYKSTGS